MSIYVDLTEFLARPYRTGIQRVTGELCRHWPGSAPLVPVTVRDGGLTEMPPGTLNIIGDYFRRATVPDEALSEGTPLFGDMGSTGRSVTLQNDDVLLCPEVFYDPDRISYYWDLPAALRARCCFFIHDLLPITHPELFQPNVPHERISRYFSLLRRIGNLGFNSRATQREFCRRFLRSSELKGRVLRLGSDGLAEHRPSATLHTTHKFVVLGTIEPRKNHSLILEAFRPVLEERPSVELAFAGKMGWATSAVQEQISQFQREFPQFRLITDADDGLVKDLVSTARATIYASSAEGFGLPPVESLWMGVPVICGPAIPSIEEIGSRGVHIVDPLTPGNLREACLAFLDDEYYAAKVHEAVTVDLPDWGSFAAEMEAWAREVEATDRAVVNLPIAEAV